MPVVTQAQQFNDTVTGPDDAAVAIELDAIVSGQNGQPLTGNAVAADAGWFTDMTHLPGRAAPAASLPRSPRRPARCSRARGLGG